MQFSIGILPSESLDSLSSQIESVIEQCARLPHHQAAEIIVMDAYYTQQRQHAVEGLSSDKTPVRYVETTQGETTPWQNVVAEQARGHRLVFISDRCRIADNWLEILVQGLEEHSDAKVLYGRITTEDNWIFPFKVPYLYQDEPNRTIGIAIEADFFREIGGYDEDASQILEQSDCPLSGWELAQRLKEKDIEPVFLAQWAMHMPVPYYSPVFGDKLFPPSKIQSLVYLLRRYPEFYRSKPRIIRLCQRDIQMLLLRLAFLVMAFATLSTGRAVGVIILMNLILDAWTLIPKQLKLIKIGLSLRTSDIVKIMTLRWLGNLEGAIYFCLITLARFGLLGPSQPANTDSVIPVQMAEKKQEPASVPVS